MRNRFETYTSHECAFRAFDTHIRTWLNNQYQGELGQQDMPFWLHRDVEIHTPSKLGLPGHDITVRGMFRAWCSGKAIDFICDLEVSIGSQNMELVAENLQGEIRPAG